MAKQEMSKEEILKEKKKYLLKCHEEVMLLVEYALEIGKFPSQLEYDELCTLNIEIQGREDLSDIEKKLAQAKTTLSSQLAPISLDALRYKYGRQKNLLECYEDVMLLANHAVDIGKLPEGFDYEAICNLDDDIQKGLNLEDIEKKLAKARIALSGKLAPVTPDTLRYTDRRNRHKEPYNKVFVHLKRIYIISYITMGIIVAVNLSRYIFQGFIQIPNDWPTTPVVADFVLRGFVDHLYPFLYGLLGTCLYLLRMSGVHLRQRDFDIGRISEHWNRVPLGTISGGIISLFVSTEVSVEDTPIVLSQGALGFMAGYSVDILFSIIDRVKNVLVPPVDNIQAAANPKQPPQATPAPQQPAAPDKPDKPEGEQEPEVAVVNRIEVKPVGVVTEEEEKKD